MVVRIVLTLALIFSVAVCFVKPKMHAPVLVYDSEFELVEEKTETPKPVASEVVTPKTVQKSQITKSPVVKKQTTAQTKTVKDEKVVKDTKPAVKNVEKKSAPPVVVTQSEETIAWNKWHSDLQNSIMRDTRLPIVPSGTKFYFTFTVDKNGKITNIKTWSDTPEYTVYAIQYIAPVIRGYQGKDILTFPESSQRTVTDFEGRFKTSRNAENKYSSSSDFNDSETIRK